MEIYHGIAGSNTRAALVVEAQVLLEVVWLARSIQVMSGPTILGPRKVARYRQDAHH